VDGSGSRLLLGTKRLHIGLGRRQRLRREPRSVPGRNVVVLPQRAGGRLHVVDGHR
jgi:hypothetical protein